MEIYNSVYSASHTAVVKLIQLPFLQPVFNKIGCRIKNTALYIIVDDTGGNLQKSGLRFYSRLGAKMLKAFIDMALRTNIKKLNNWHSYCVLKLKLMELITGIG